MTLKDMISENHSSSEKAYITHGDIIKNVVDVVIWIVTVVVTAIFIIHDIYFTAGTAFVLGSFAHIRWNKYCETIFRISVCSIIYNSFIYNKATIEEAKRFFETELDESERLYFRPALLRYIDEYPGDNDDS